MKDYRWLLVMASLLSGCGVAGETSSGGSECDASVPCTPPGCTPGLVQECPCLLSTSTGIQQCGKDGTFSSCMGCPPPSDGGAPLKLVSGNDGDRLHSTYEVGDDGARGRVSGVWWDVKRSEQCQRALADDGKYRCIPTLEKQGLITGYVDSGCTMPLYEVNSGGTPLCSEYVGFQVPASDVCHPPGRSIFLIGQKLSLSMWYQPNQGSCVALPPAPGHDYYSLTGPIPATSFVALDVTH
jgi:hypothetical protein